MAAVLRNQGINLLSNLFNKTRPAMYVLFIGDGRAVVNVFKLTKPLTQVIMVGFMSMCRLSKDNNSGWSDSLHGDR